MLPLQQEIKQNKKRHPMASEVNDVIEDYMRSHKSPIELQKEVEDIYGADAEETMSIDEARKVYLEIHGWTSDHNIVMQDYLVKQCGITYQWNKDDPKPILLGFNFTYSNDGNNLESITMFFQKHQNCF